MQIRVVSDQPWSVRADVLAVPITSDEPAEPDAPTLVELDRRLDGAIGDQFMQKLKRFLEEYSGQ